MYPDSSAGSILARGALCGLLSVVAVLALAGCTHSQPAADLVIINGAEPESLDPAVLTGEADGRVALVVKDEHFQVESIDRYCPKLLQVLSKAAITFDQDRAPRAAGNGRTNCARQAVAHRR